MYYHRINRAIRSARVDVIRNYSAPVKAIIYGKQGEFAVAHLDMSNLKAEFERIKDAGRALNAEQLIYVGSSPVDDRYLPCSKEASKGKEAITVFCESDDRVEVISKPFRRVSANNIMFGKKYHYLIAEDGVHRIEKTDPYTDSNINTDEKHGSVGMESLMN